MPSRSEESYGLKADSNRADRISPRHKPAEQNVLSGSREGKSTRPDPSPSPGPLTISLRRAEYARGLKSRRSRCSLSVYSSTA